MSGLEAAPRDIASLPLHQLLRPYGKQGQGIVFLDVEAQQDGALGELTASAPSPKACFRI